MKKQIQRVLTFVSTVILTSCNPPQLPPSPTLTTTLISSIAATSAVSGGTITTNGYTATASGVVWSTSTNPTIALSTKTTDGTLTGSFTSAITGLTANTTYYVKAYATFAIGTIYGNEVSFTTIGNIDNDGNTITTVVIGTQEWTQKNLNETKYRNGDVIPQVTDATAWAGLTTGAWCYYANDTANGLVYGKLYNWYAVNDPRGIAPAGWHVASDAEWTTLTDYLGGESLAGGKMKSTLVWNSPNAGATNSSGFTALPGGFRNNDGTFYSLGNNGYYWSSTENNTTYAYFRNLFYDIGSTNRGYNDKKNGISVRCVKD